MHPDLAYRQTGNATRYTIYRLPYKPAAVGEGPYARRSRSRPSNISPLTNAVRWFRHTARTKNVALCRP